MTYTSFLVVPLVACLAAVLAPAGAAPRLTLPFFRGEPHRINGGSTYGCYLHDRMTNAVRYDLNADGKITLPDVTQFGPYFNKSCAP